MDRKDLYRFLRERLISTNPIYSNMDKETEIDLEEELAYTLESYDGALEFQKNMQEVEKHKPEEHWGLRCLRCGGSGTLTHYENGGPSGEYWEMPVTEDCPDCFEQGFCPVCHEKFEVVGKQVICRRCGWSDTF